MGCALTCIFLATNCDMVCCNLVELTLYCFLSSNEIYMQQLNFVVDNGTKCSNFQLQYCVCGRLDGLCTHKICVTLSHLHLSGKELHLHEYSVLHSSGA